MSAADETALDVRTFYRRTLERRGFVADVAQQRAVERLQQLYDQLVDFKQKRHSRLRWLMPRPVLPRGIYLWGGVGRGKSFLMDSFYACVPFVRKQRVHFHHFMRDVHRELDTLKGEPDRLDLLAQRIAERFRLICFDEMHVNDVADAMILGRLLRRTMDLGVVYCMTSNYAPDGLYKDGLQRDDFLPTIALLKQRLDVVEVDNGVDYRRRALAQLSTYHVPADVKAEAALTTAFERLAETEEETGALEIEGRSISYRRRAGSVVWFDFDKICGWGRSQLDYLEIAQEFRTVILSHVPRFGPERAEEARRFTLLVDVLYEHGVKLLISADTAPEQLLKKDEVAKTPQARAMIFEFDRTASRLIEMQSREYLDQLRR
ncbi:MAG: cell division protein ZapE [Gammaproteobacteria bacterium]|nr:cell division protein ZapE [Gammaproteobacteria bacterium]